MSAASGYVLLEDGSRLDGELCGAADAESLGIGHPTPHRFVHRT